LGNIALFENKFGYDFLVKNSGTKQFRQGRLGFAFPQIKNKKLVKTNTVVIREKTRE